MSHLVSEHPTICEAAKSAIVEVKRLCVGVGFDATLLVSPVGADPVLAWHGMIAKNGPSRGRLSWSRDEKEG